MKRTLIAAAIAAGTAAAPAHAATEIDWWHAMGGKLGEKVKEIAGKFNAAQTQCKVNAVYKGNYTETMTAAIAAFRARKQPHVVQVFEVGTASMMAAKGAIYPVWKLMEDTGQAFDPKAYLQAVVGYYTTPDGKMLSMPFNSSTPVLYYNKDLFKKAGLDPNRPPRTWPELAAAAKAVMEKTGAKCGFTTGWQSWVQLENFSAWHNVPFATAQNGFASTKTELAFNKGPALMHIAKLAEWQKGKVFDYGGRRSDSAAKFYSGECAMYMNSSASRAGIQANVKGKFAFGTAKLPYWPSVKGAPQNSIIGGATLWVLSGHPKPEYQCTAKFFAFLSTPEVQSDWHKFTGYLPITYAAYELTKKEGYYDKNPGAEVAIKQMTGKDTTPNSKGLRLGNFVQIRDIINEELEAIWAGKKTAKQGLDEAVSRGNALLRKFERETTN